MISVSDQQNFVVMLPGKEVSFTLLPESDAIDDQEHGGRRVMSM
jgi:hypothetical protein